MKSTKTTAFFAFLAFAIFATLLPVQARAGASASEINAEVTAALRNLYSDTPKARELGTKALAVLVFPKIIKGGFLIAGQHGEGGLVYRGHGITRYYATTSASYGLQAGVQKFGYAMFFMNSEALSYLRSSSGWEVGSAPSLVVMDKGMAGSMSTTSLKKGIYVFFFNQQGLMGGLGLQGTKITQIQPSH